MATDSGQRRLNTNTLERVISDDINRAQKFGAAALGDALLQLLTRSVVVANVAGRQQVQSPIALTAPLTACVLGGLLVNPQAGLMLIDAGTLAAVVPGGTADDSDLALVTSDGSAGIAITPNVSGTRWDLVECSVNSAVVETTASVAIYNPGTQTFSNQVRNKVITGTLTFRVRVGTPGSGVPAVASGWLPLAAVLHVGATASFDDCEVYDVRPLLDDRNDAGRQAKFSIGRNQACWYCNPGGATEFEARVILESVPGGNPVDATADISGLNGSGLGMRAAGLVYGGLPGNETSSDIEITDHIAQGLTLSANTWYGVALAYPRGLPRWQKLSKTATSGRRWPQGGAGGILVINILPGSGQAASSISRLPVECNDPNSHRCAFFGVFRTDGGASILPGESTWDGWTHYTQMPAVLSSAVSTAAGATTDQFVLTRGGTNPLPNVQVSGIEMWWNHRIAGASPGNTKAAAPQATVFRTTTPFFPFCRADVAVAENLLPADTTARSHFRVFQSDFAGSSGASFPSGPWQITVAVVGMGAIVAGTAPTDGALNLTGIQVAF